MADVLINGVRQGWGDIQFMAMGLLITGITEISIEMSQDKENEYGSGNEPVHRSHGNKKYGAKMKLYKYEIDRILGGMSAGKDLTDVAPFTLNVVFMPKGSDQLKRLDIPMTEFKNGGLNFDIKQGDKSISSPLELAIGKPMYR